MNELDDHALEQRIGRLVPRGAPRELRQRVLASIFEAHPPLRHRGREFLLDHVGGLATAALILLAAISWWVNLRLQERRLAALLGPTAAERRVDRLVASVERIADPEQLDAIRHALLASLKRCDPRRGPVAAVDSVLPNQKLLAEWFQNEVEKDRENRAEYRGDTTNRRRVDQLEIARTA